MFKLDVRADIRGTARYLTDVQRRQVPFATSGALNDTAFGVRTRIVTRTWPRAFQVKNRRFAGVAFRVAKASKRKLVASVYDRLGRDYIARHITGGTKRPRGRHVAVPQPGVGRTAGGAVRKAQRPRQILNRKGAYKVPLRKGGEGVFLRTRGAKRGTFMYALATSARIRRRFPFHEDAARSAGRQFPAHFRRRLRRALATAR